MNNEAERFCVMITVTQRCNLNCSYCYENNKSNKDIPLDVAKSIIDRELSLIPEGNPIEFSLFGGEPFLAFDLVRTITEYICKSVVNHPFVIFTTTNGTLVHGEIQKWLKDRKKYFACGLSLDGTREMQNTNRSGSYDEIDLDFFLQQYPEQGVKMTVSQDTLPMFSTGVIELHEKGFPVACNLAHGIDWSQPTNTEVLQRELYRLIDYYLLHPNVKPCTMLEMDISAVATESSQVMRYCGAGKAMRSYDVDGKGYPCQFFMPLSVGSTMAEKSKYIDFPDKYIPNACLDKKCQKCVVKAVCPNCFGANYADSGNIYKRERGICRLTKVIMKARSYFRARQWELGQLELEERETQSLLHAIVKIQTELDLDV